MSLYFIYHHSLQEDLVGYTNSEEEAKKFVAECDYPDNFRIIERPDNIIAQPIKVYWHVIISFDDIVINDANTSQMKILEKEIHIHTSNIVYVGKDPTYTISFYLRMKDHSKEDTLSVAIKILEKVKQNKEMLATNSLKLEEILSEELKRI